MSGPGYIKPEPPSTCELCGAFEETRPYGPKGERVCFTCAQKDPVAMDRGMDRYIFTKPRPVQTREDVTHTFYRPVGCCPRCNSAIQGQTHAAPGQRGAPKPGDTCICVYCGLLMTFTRTMQLRAMTPREIAKASDDGKKFWNELQMRIKLVMAKDGPVQ